MQSLFMYLRRVSLKSIHGADTSMYMYASHTIYSQSKIPILPITLDKCPQPMQPNENSLFLSTQGILENTQTCWKHPVHINVISIVLPKDIFSHPLQ